MANIPFWWWVGLGVGGVIGLGALVGVAIWMDGGGD
jgi:hypothetical protein